jgi:hypothetical protein
VKYFIDYLKSFSVFIPWFDRCGQVGGLVDLLPQGRAGVWTAMKNIGITLARQKITNYLFKNQTIADKEA